MPYELNKEEKTGFDIQYNSIPRRIERTYSKSKSWLRIKVHGWWWGTLWAIGLGRWYGRTTCRLGIYKKFPDGRCQYCGNTHN